MSEDKTTLAGRQWFLKTLGAGAVALSVAPYLEMSALSPREAVAEITPNGKWMYGTCSFCMFGCPPMFTSCHCGAVDIAARLNGHSYSGQNSGRPNLTIPSQCS